MDITTHIERCASDFQKALEIPNYSWARFHHQRMLHYAEKDFTAHHLAEAMKEDLQRV